MAAAAGGVKEKEEFVSGMYQILEDYCFDMVDEVEARMIERAGEKRMTETVKQCIDRMADELQKGFEGPFGKFEEEVAPLFELMKRREKQAITAVDQQQQQPEKKKRKTMLDGKKTQEEEEKLKEEMNEVTMAMKDSLSRLNNVREKRSRAEKRLKETKAALKSLQSMEAVVSPQDVESLMESVSTLKNLVRELSTI